MADSGQGKVDKNGKTEERFLREYDVTKYFRPSVTVDAVLCKPTAAGGKILLIKRGGHPFIGEWAFPGGFVEKDEPCEDAACRELFEETGIKDVPLRQLLTVSTPGRDPRWRNITVVFYAVTDELNAVGGDDAALAQWFDFKYTRGDKGAELSLSGGGETLYAKLDIVRDAFGAIDLNKTKITERDGIAFDHAKIICALAEVLGK